MARNAPTRVRAGLRRRPRPTDGNPRRVVPGLSGPTQRLVADLELALGEPPGALAVAVDRWRAVAYRHSRSRFFTATCPCCAYESDRPLIERVLNALPRLAARELRAVVEPMDAAFLAARVRSGDEAWW